MSVRLALSISDDLSREIDLLAARSATPKGEVFRKALQLYLAAHDGKARGLKLGLIDPETGRMQEEVIGL